MNNIPVECFYSRLPEITMQSVMKALEIKEWFGLKGKKSLVIFCPTDLKSYWINNKGNITAGYGYTNENAFIDAVKMQLISHREFISRVAVLQVFDKIKILE